MGNGDAPSETGAAELFALRPDRVKVVLDTGPLLNLDGQRGWG